jgi:hypothetical protein
MHITKDSIPTRIDVPGATARQLEDFGDAHGTIGAEYFSFGAGTDLAPLLAGLDSDACHAPHWGYIISGDLTVTYTDATTERCVTGDVFHWPAGHSVRAEADSEIILFSPQHEHGEVLDHVQRQILAT